MNYIKTFGLLAILTMLLVWVGNLIGGPQGATVALMFALVLNVGSFWFSDRLILAMYKAQEIPRNQFPKIYHIVEELAKEAKIPTPRIYIINHNAPNAFATGRSPEVACVCVTKGILDLLDREQLKGVLAHELAHIKNRDTLIMTVAATLAGAIMMLATWARWAAIFGGFGRSRDRQGGGLIGLLAIAILAPLAALIVQLAISRSREYAADSAGARFAHSPLGLSGALDKLSKAAKRYRMPASPQTSHLFIVNPLRGDFLATLFSTHPPVERRIERLRAKAG